MVDFTGIGCSFVNLNINFLVAPIGVKHALRMGLASGGFGGFGPNNT